MTSRFARRRQSTDELTLDVTAKTYRYLDEKRRRDDARRAAHFGALRSRRPRLPRRLSACGGGNDDLRAYIDEVKARPGGRIEPLPQVQPAPHVRVRAPASRRSPFTPDAPQRRVSTRSERRRRARSESAARIPRAVSARHAAHGRHARRSSARASAWCRRRTASCTASRSAITWDRTTAASWRSRIQRFNWWRSSPTVSAGTWSDPRRLAWPIEAQGSLGSEPYEYVSARPSRELRPVATSTLGGAAVLLALALSAFVRARRSRRALLERDRRAAAAGAQVELQAAHERPGAGADELHDRRSRAHLARPAEHDARARRRAART